MSNHKFVVDGSLPNLNEIINVAKLHYGAYAKMKKDAQKRIMWAIQLHKVTPKRQGITDVHIHFVEKNRRRDKDNITVGTKFILDSLVEMEVLENDGWKHIGNLSYSFDVDKENPRIEVTLSAGLHS